jgi:hypothetical protein
MLTCPLCGRDIDATGPGVSSHRADYDPVAGPSGQWISAWVPFIEDLRGTPQRLVHPACFAGEAGTDALVDIVHKHDKLVRHENARRWKTRGG